jgi:DNA-binding HxlR family transcriptional regulator
MFKDLDPILHSQLRLAVVSLLVSVKEAEFNYLKEKTRASAGNLSAQLTKLAEAGYISVKKTFRDNYPLTLCRITPEGLTAFEKYVDDLRQYLTVASDGKK